ncbi:hypothetical protein DFP72DRAFT_1106115 [Ephemerocybe angulata]|uniref:Uncharacterized protein n=1 Tax=Ephemerocybe angulata TaxID=980116 RepID=A0A8H6H8G2_9AGAR|nr:hypothetical protein DFP72DRAFT_1106115 [Tulosesus angulatus]
MTNLTDEWERDRADQDTYILAFWLGGFAFGLYCVLFLFSLRIMVQKRRVSCSWSAKVSYIATLFIFILTTVYMGLNVSRFRYAFSPEWTPDLNGKLPIYHLRDYTSTRGIAEIVIMAVLIWSGNALAILRCFIIWDRRWCIALPLITLLTFSMVSGSIVIAAFSDPATAPPHLVKLLTGIVLPVNIGVICLTTGLITFKIGLQHRDSREAGLRTHGGRGVGLLAVICIIGESAMIFTALQVAICIAFYTNNAGLKYIFNEMLVSSIGGTFALMMIRVDAAKSEGPLEFTLPHICSSPGTLPGGADSVSLSVAAGGWNRGRAATEELRSIQQAATRSATHRYC